MLIVKTSIKMLLIYVCFDTDDSTFVLCYANDSCVLLADFTMTFLCTLMPLRTHSLPISIHSGQRHLQHQTSIPANSHPCPYSYHQSSRQQWSNTAPVSRSVPLPSRSNYPSPLSPTDTCSVISPPSPPPAPRRLGAAAGSAEASLWRVRGARRPV